MRDVTQGNLTALVVNSFAGLPQARLRLLVQSLVAHLHQFAAEVNLSHSEWRAALGFLHRVGAMSSDSRSEFSLLSDVIGLSSLVDLLASDPSASPGSVLGPFHSVGSPWTGNPAQLIGTNTGLPVVLRGQVCDAAGQALGQATLDFWQNAANGLYWQQDPQQPTDNLRCQLQVDTKGCFEIVTIKPVPYQIPTDGPVWLDLVQPAGRSSWRPAHFHLIVSAPGYRTLVTELFESDDPYLESDAVFGVRAPLIGSYQPLDDASCKRLGLAAAHALLMPFELRLAPDNPATKGDDDATKKTI
jgi:protocatechuate 3,4-dioxygenase beta subunit